MEKITSRRNPLCVHMKNLGASRSYREERREFLCDGLKLLEEAVTAGADITNVLASSHLPFPLPVDTSVYFTDSGVINSISTLKNARDTLFTVKMPPSGGFDSCDGTYVLLDGVQDPGNVGTVVRTAFAFGVKGVILTGSCADLYNPKTIRATMGAIFRQKVFSMSSEELAKLRSGGMRFVGAVPGGPGSAVDVIIKNTVIAVGSEGKGLSEEILELCDESISIPISPDCDSLNAAVAAAILMWEAADH